MAIHPESGTNQDGSPEVDTAELPAARGRGKRRPGLAVLCALLGLGGLVSAAVGMSGQLMPRAFTVAQRHRIEAWEVARRWRTIPKTRIFPMVVRYRLAGGQIGAAGSLMLSARRLEIARQASCRSATGVSGKLMPMLDRAGCQAILRATYTDASSSLVLTVGIAVLRNAASAVAVARDLSDGVANGRGAVADRFVLSPVPVPGTPAAAFGLRQRQLSWVVGAGSYLVMATVGFADARPRVPVATDVYAYLEMTSLAGGVADVVAAPLGARPAIPRCPATGTPPC